MANDRKDWLSIEQNANQRIRMAIKRKETIDRKDRLPI